MIITALAPVPVTIPLSVRASAPNTVYVYVLDPVPVPLAVPDSVPAPDPIYVLDPVPVPVPTPTSDLVYVYCLNKCCVWCGYSYCISVGENSWIQCYGISV